MLQQSLFQDEQPTARESNSGKEKNGIVYTKPWVVDLILDLVGYAPEAPLCHRTILEPAAGSGTFLRAIVGRLAESCRRHGVDLADCVEAVVAYELEPEAVVAARRAVVDELVEEGVSAGDATSLADGWVRRGDFLLDSNHLIGKVDYVVGNPPYIRLEDMARGGAAYRSFFETMIGRSDIYVAFFEASLRHLRPGGSCCFICADRWMYNQYGARLRRYVTRGFAVDVVAQMHNSDPFEQDVSAYPAVTVIRRGEQGPVIVASLGAGAERRGGRSLAQAIRSAGPGGSATWSDGVNASCLPGWFSSDDPWPAVEPDQLALLQRLERQFPTIEEAGATIGIGVATGADKVYITSNPDLVEADRLLPLAMACDIDGTSLRWSGAYLVNPWNATGLVDLAGYPRLQRYLEDHREALMERHVGKKNSRAWYRTIDRVCHSLVGETKLFIPDIRGRITPVLDRGKTYPHHNLYFVSPGPWDAEVLGGLLLSNVAQFFVESYGVRMRGGYLRFQAQYLRRIRVPACDSIRTSLGERLRSAFPSKDIEEANRVASELYGLSREDEELLGYRETT